MKKKSRSSICSQVSPASASPSSLWPTPIGQDTNNLDPQEFLRRKKRKPDGAITSLNVAVAMWRTPSDPSNRGGSQPEEKRRAGGHTINLEDQVEHSAQ